MFHHPYGWLPANNARDLRKHVEENSDILLTGHEHEGCAYAKEAFTGENITYLEGGVLQDIRENVSTFNVMLVELGNRRFRVEQYRSLVIFTLSISKAPGDLLFAGNYFFATRFQLITGFLGS